jgi:hypothetical protein
MPTKLVTRCGWSRTTQPRSVIYETRSNNAGNQAPSGAASAVEANGRCRPDGAWIIEADFFYKDGAFAEAR